VSPLEKLARVGASAVSLLPAVPGMV